MAAYTNNLLTKVAAGGLCKAFGVRLVTNTQVVQLAQNAGFDSLFSELEHSTISLDDASNLSRAGLLSGITPFVSVPHQCGNGFVQRVLDGGAMGVIFPHIQNAKEAQAAVAILKYPPLACRSLTGQLPLFSLKPTRISQVVEHSNSNASTAVMMIENNAAIENIDEIAAVVGVDVLLVGSNDLSIELGVQSGFGTEAFRAALYAVSTACKKHKKIMGLAGIYDQYDLQEWATRELGVQYMLLQQDSGLIAGGAMRCTKAVADL